MANQRPRPGKAACLAIDSGCRAEKCDRFDAWGRQSVWWIVRNGNGEAVAQASNVGTAWRNAFQFIRNRQENPREAP